MIKETPGFTFRETAILTPVAAPLTAERALQKFARQVKLLRASFVGHLTNGGNRAPNRMAFTFRGARLQKLWEVLPEYALTAVSGWY